MPRHPGWGKALATLYSYLGIVAYLITQGRGMVQHNAGKFSRRRTNYDAPFGFSVADEITKLDRLNKSGSITGANEPE